MSFMNLSMENVTTLPKQEVLDMCVGCSLKMLPIISDKCRGEVYYNEWSEQLFEIDKILSKSEYYSNTLKTLSKIARAVYPNTLSIEIVNGNYKKFINDCINELQKQNITIKEESDNVVIIPPQLTSITDDTTNNTDNLDEIFDKIMHNKNISPDDLKAFETIIKQGITTKNIIDLLPDTRDFLELSNEEIEKGLLDNSLNYTLAVAILKAISLEDIFYIVSNKQDILTDIDIEKDTIDQITDGVLLKAFDKLPEKCKDVIFKIIKKIAFLNTGVDEDLNFVINKARGLKSALTPETKTPKAKTEKQETKTPKTKTEKQKSEEDDTIDAIQNCIAGHEDFPIVETGNIRIEDGFPEYVNLITGETVGYFSFNEINQYREIWNTDPANIIKIQLNHNIKGLNPIDALYFYDRIPVMYLNTQQEIMQNQMILCACNNHTFCVYKDFISLYISNDTGIIYNLYLLDKNGKQLMTAKELYLFMKGIVTDSLPDDIFKHYVDKKILVAMGSKINNK